jgi:Putative prokaryotic signal transducing protein
MTPDELVVLATFVNNFDAEVARSALEAAGIDVMIRADDCGGLRPHLWMGGVEIVVRREDAERAHEVLNAETQPTDPPSENHL